jgi:hypothetical protein
MSSEFGTIRDAGNLNDREILDLMGKVENDWDKRSEKANKDKNLLEIYREAHFICVESRTVIDRRNEGAIQKHKEIL